MVFLYFSRARRSTRGWTGSYAVSGTGTVGSCAEEKDGAAAAMRRPQPAAVTNELSRMRSSLIVVVPSVLVIPSVPVIPSRRRGIAGLPVEGPEETAEGRALQMADGRWQGRNGRGSAAAVR